MIYLLLCILSSTGIFIVFKYLDKRLLPSFPVIVLNYFVASVFGFIINGNELNFETFQTVSWIPISVLIGFLFIVMFFVIARSSQQAGLSITTVASKMSVVFPIVFSIIVEPDDRLTPLKAIAILLALVGVLLTVYKPDDGKTRQASILIPVILFIGMGIVDSLVKFSQHQWVKEDDTALFSAVLFGMAFLTGIIILPFRKSSFSEFRIKEIWLWGLVLGIVNFGSIYLMISALNWTNQSGQHLDSSIIFGANNIGIVTLSVLFALAVFREKLRALNWIGIGISVTAILFFAFS